MVDCFKCKTSMGKFSLKFDAKGLGKLGISTPPSMNEDDRLCSACVEHLQNPQKVKEYEQHLEKTESKKIMKTETEELVRKGEDYKLKWNKNGIIQFKNERIAILKRMLGSQVEFIVAFDELTEEGYRLMAHDEGTEVTAGGFSGGANSYFYFQKIDFVSVGHQKLERDIPEKVDPTTTRNAL